MNDVHQIRLSWPSMDERAGSLLDELRNLMGDLGEDGGLISPSVYDTAQVLRRYPPPEGVEPGLEWLLGQQRQDGGWGEPEKPITRDIPTLAAMLALHELGHGRPAQAAVEAGREFLERREWSWQDVPMDAVPIAAELILPDLLEQAHAAGIHLAPERYARLLRLRQRKLAALKRHTLVAGQAPTYSWEALGAPAHDHLIDATGSVGHSPSATAAYLRACAREGVAPRRPLQAAERYLRLASRATGQGVPGVVPTVWPISGFERLYGLYALHLTDLLAEPSLQRAGAQPATIPVALAAEQPGVRLRRRLRARCRLHRRGHLRARARCGRCHA